MQVRDNESSSVLSDRSRPRPDLQRVEFDAAKQTFAKNLVARSGHNCRLG
jgi:hypothetical protein